MCGDEYVLWLADLLPTSSNTGLRPFLTALASDQSNRSATLDAHWRALVRPGYTRPRRGKVDENEAESGDREILGRHT